MIELDLSPEAVEFQQFRVPERLRATACAFGVSIATKLKSFVDESKTLPPET